MAPLHAAFAASLAEQHGERVEIITADGSDDAYVFTPEGPGPWPVVLFYMDGPGIRPALFEMARRLANQGYYVLLPNLFYRSGAYQPFDPATVFAQQAERERLMGLIYTVTQAHAMQDTAGIFTWLDSQPRADATRVGTVGYCMGGSQALNAAGFFPERVKAAAAFHAGRLATEQPDSPHLLAEHITAALYIGVAGIDHGFDDAQRQRLESALTAAGVPYELEVYAGVQHGFAIADLPIYDAPAAEQHWQKLLALFAAELG